MTDHVGGDYATILAPRIKRRERMEFALPTINVIFLLMLYFLIAGTIVQKDELSVAPPITTEDALERLPRPLLVITDAETFTLDGALIAHADLVAAAATAIAGPLAQTPQLNVLAPADMGAGPFLELLELLGAGGVPVRLVTVEAGTAP
jgi:biopolymer transport protein ExbD